MRYSLVGAFKSPEVRAKIPYAGEGVQAGADPGTAYLIAYISRKFGPVFVMRGKMTGGRCSEPTSMEICMADHYHCFECRKVFPLIGGDVD